MRLNMNNYRVKILVVDDVEPVRLQIQDGLTLFGQKVSTAHSGAKALEMFRREYFDLVICDLSMPEMDGHEVAREIREICEREGVSRPRFVLLTGWGGIEELEDQIPTGYVDKVMQKPADIWALWDMVQELVPSPALAPITECYSH
jgi:CheY-like chemotaxis protein